MSEDRRQSSEDGSQMTEVREYGIRPALARLNWYRVLSIKLIVLMRIKFELRQSVWARECGLRPVGAYAPEGVWKYSISDCGMDTLRASGINPLPQSTNQPINNLTNTKITR